LAHKGKFQRLQTSLVSFFLSTVLVTGCMSPFTNNDETLFEVARETADEVRALSERANALAAETHYILAGSSAPFVSSNGLALISGESSGPGLPVDRFRRTGMAKHRTAFWLGVNILMIAGLVVGQIVAVTVAAAAGAVLAYQQASAAQAQPLGLQPVAQRAGA
jgi:hypothetical protein